MHDYIYDLETELYSFLRIPKILLQHEEYQKLSLDALLLYSLLLDRVGISIENGWKDEYGRVYIIFTVDEAARILKRSKRRAIQILQELEQKADLIERKKQGLCKPNLIYVKSLIRTGDKSGKTLFLNCEKETS